MGQDFDYDWLDKFEMTYKPQRKTTGFKVGDKVRRRGGVDLQTVYKISNGKIFAKYDKSGQDYYPKGQEPHQICLVQSNEEEDTMTKAKLYEVNDATSTLSVFASHIATNSAGLWVMEEKGTGRVFTTDKANCEEVIPHTIDIEFTEGFGTHYSYYAPKDAYKKGDFYFMLSPSGLSVVRIVGVNTKKNATKDFTPFAKIVTEPVDTE